MDRFTRNYLIGLGLFAVFLIGLWIASNWQPGLAPLNRLLQEDKLLANYPYQFKVVSLKKGVATLSSPRSFEVPVIRFLGVLYPRLSGRPDNDPDVREAQAELVRVQKHAQAIVLEQPEVNSTRWKLDVDWYRSRGIHIP